MKEVTVAEQILNQEETTGGVGEVSDYSEDSS